MKVVVFDLPQFLGSSFNKRGAFFRGRRLYHPKNACGNVFSQRNWQRKETKKWLTSMTFL